MTRVRLTGVLVLALVAGALSFPLTAGATLEWTIVESSMPGLCGGESEEAREAAHKKHDCIVIAESACESTPATSEQALLHSEGCEIVKEAAARRGSTSTPGTEEGGGGGGGDGGLIAGIAAAALVLASAAWVAVDRRKRDFSQATGPKTGAAQIAGVVLLWPIFFPLYLLQRRNAPAAGAMP
jgi:hypothetical protein